MPFTVSHAAAALPFARSGLVLSAVIIGTMTPDFPYFLQIHGISGLTHSLAGVVTVDLLLGLAAFTLWSAVLRRPVIDLGPGWIHSRIPAAAARADLPRGIGIWALIALSVAVGAFTHVLWDSFTHTGAWGVQQLDFLDTRIAGRATYRWLQFVSGAVALVVLAGWVRHWVRSTPARPRPREVAAIDPGLPLKAWLAVGGATVFAAIVVWRVELGNNVATVSSDMVYAVIVGSGGFAAATAVAICVAWQLARSRIGAGRTGGPRR